MNKTFNITYLVSKIIFIVAIFLLVLLIIRHIIGIEYNYESGGYNYLVEIPILDWPIMTIGIILLGISMFYYPILLIFLILFFIFRKKEKIKQTKRTISFKQHLLICVLTFLIGFVVIGVSGYLKYGY